MEKEIQYIKTKIKRIDDNIEVLTNLAAQSSDYSYSLQKIREEYIILNNILVVLNKHNEKLETDLKGFTNSITDIQKNRNK